MALPEAEPDDSPVGGMIQIPGLRLLEGRQHLYRRLCDDQHTLLDPSDLNARMRPTLTQIQPLGYAERDHEIDPQTTTVAQPVRVRDRVHATVGLTFFRGAKADRGKILEAMNAAVARLEQMAAEIELG